MKRLPLATAISVLFTCQIAVSSDRFQIYAPSRSDDAVLTLTFSAPDSLDLKETCELGFSARTVAQHPSKPLLYLSGGSPGKPNFAVAHLDEKTQLISKANPITVAREYSYLSVDKTGSYLLGCNYGAGIIDVYQLDETGTPDPSPVSTLDEGRKAAHCVLTSPDNRHFYIPYVKEHNALYQYSFDENSGALAALDPKNAMPPEGTGPRHLAYHPDLPLLYFSEEQGLGISVYKRDEKSGKLSFSSRARAAGDDAPTEGVSASDIVITPDAKFLYTGIRGHRHDYDFLAGYAIQEDGSLEPIGMTETSKVPWGLAVSPDGRYLVTTAFKGGEILVYQIGEDGSLTKAASLPVSENISDVETRSAP